MVTGGAGFIGSHLTRRLLRRATRSLVVDNFCSGTRANLADQEVGSRLTILRHDVHAAVRRGGRDLPPGLPGLPGVLPARPGADHEDLVHGLDQHARPGQAHRRPVLLASTSEVYGDPAVHPQDEAYWGNVNPIGPRSCYDEGKRCAEALFFDYRRQHDLPIKVARIFNTYGPGMRPTTAAWSPTSSCRRCAGEPLTVFGDGSQTRSFCYVDDLVDGLMRLMDTRHEVTGPINLGNPDEFTMLELAELVLEHRRASSGSLEHGRCPRTTRAAAARHRAGTAGARAGPRRPRWPRASTRTIAYFR